MERAQASRVGIGTSVPRREDLRLLTGRGQYTDDVNPPRACHAAFVRSPHAHARIGAIDIAQALRAAGVIAVLTGADLAADGVLPIPHSPRWHGAPDAELRLAPEFQVFETRHTAMAQDVVRFVGEPVAMVVAESRAAAADAAALIEVDYAPLPALARAVDALMSGAPSVWPERPSNVALDCEVGDRAATDAAFAKAVHVVRLRTWIQRVTGAPMEPRSVAGEYDEARRRYVLHTGSGGGVIRIREQFVEMFGLSRDDCRMLCGDMGGNFGTRNTFFPEYALLPWAARRIGRPVKWTAERQECFVSDYQGRDLAVEAELALDADGNFLAVRGTNISNIGAYTAHFVPLRKGLGIMQGVYAIPAVHFRGLAVMTNTAPTTPYRSAGRPEAIFVIERLVDLAATEYGFDPIALRRRNLIQPEAMPYTNAVGITYDSGEYAHNMDTALELADWQSFSDRRAQSASRGLLRGIGIANYVEVTSGAPRERAEVTVDPDGGTELVLGTMNSGQGHETSFAQLISEWLGIPFDEVRFIAHDTDRVSAGGGSHSGRSMRLASLAIAEASDAIVAKGRSIAAHLLQARVDDIAFHGGVFEVTASGASVTLSEAARAALSNEALPADLRGPLQGVGDVDSSAGGYPSGTHICEVEVDPDTGQVEIVRWSGADDVGLAVNPLILHGQVHGAVAQGIGQAVLEDCHYDRESAQMLAASFMDYAMPRASTMPRIASRLLEVPAASHRFGIRPGGEGGTTPALGAVVNAIVNALSHLGVRHLEMPATPERVWRAIQQARGPAATAG
jgi:carbon-monoxide dehydrogenase large subunit